MSLFPMGAQLEGTIYKLALDNCPTLKGGQKACPFHNCHSGCKAGADAAFCEFNDRKWMHEKVPAKALAGKNKKIAIPLRMLARRYGDWFDFPQIDNADEVNDLNKKDLERFKAKATESRDQGGTRHVEGKSAGAKSKSKAKS